MTDEAPEDVSPPGQLNGGKPFTLDTLAERWECSGSHVRRLCASGKLRHFRIGSLYRIAVDAVLEYEIGHYGEEKAAPAPTIPALPGDKEDPVATYVRSFRQRMATQPAGTDPLAHHAETHRPETHRPGAKQE